MQAHAGQVIFAAFSGGGGLSGMKKFQKSQFLQVVFVILHSFRPFFSRQNSFEVKLINSYLSAHPDTKVLSKKCEMFIWNGDSISSQSLGSLLHHKK
jgi:hypothetical protein